MERQYREALCLRLLGMTQDQRLIGPTLSVLGAARRLLAIAEHIDRLYALRARLRPAP